MNQNMLISEDQLAGSIKGSKPVTRGLPFPGDSQTRQACHSAFLPEGRLPQAKGVLSLLNSARLHKVHKSLAVLVLSPLKVLLSILLTCLWIAVSANTWASNESTEYFVEVGDKTLVVETDETLHDIARATYGSTIFWRLIAEYNGINPVTPLAAGQLLKLPVLLQREYEYAAVSYLKGDVVISKENEPRRDLTTEDKIYLQDIVTTGREGFVSLLFRTGSTINLQPISSVQLVQLRCLETDAVCKLGLKAHRGEVFSDIRSEGQETDFQILTPYATAAVRGTEFDLEVGTAEMLLGVTEGQVDVVTTALSNSTPSEVGTGFGVITALGQAPGDLIELTGPPTFRGIPPRFSNGDKISWWKVPQGSAYIVSLARDASSQQIVTQSRQSDNVFQFSDINAGEYFVNVRSVDENGLKGFGTSQKINMVDTDETADVFELAVERDGQDLTVSIVAPDNNVSGYEMQLSESRDFSDVISIDVGAGGTAIFRSPSGDLHARARALFGTSRVSAFGPTLQVN